MAKRPIELPVPVILASLSTERRRLLTKIVRSFEVLPPQVDEQSIGGESPRAIARNRAQAKAADVFARRPDALVIAADTVAECRGEIIGKPKNRDEARRIIRKLTTRPHMVITGLCVMAPDGTRSLKGVCARVEMRPLSETEIDTYVKDADVLEFAGAYAIEPDDPRVLSLSGHESTVMGLPLEELTCILHSLYPDAVAKDEPI